MLLAHVELRDLVWYTQLARLNHAWDGSLLAARSILSMCADHGCRPDAWLPISGANTSSHFTILIWPLISTQTDGTMQYSRLTRVDFAKLSACLLLHSFTLFLFLYLVTDWLTSVSVFVECNLCHSGQRFFLLFDYHVGRFSQYGTKLTWTTFIG